MKPTRGRNTIHTRIPLMSVKFYSINELTEYKLALELFIKAAGEDKVSLKTLRLYKEACERINYVCGGADA